VAVAGTADRVNLIASAPTSLSRSLDGRRRESQPDGFALMEPSSGRQPHRPSVLRVDPLEQEHSIIAVDHGPRGPGSAAPL
jgi:hypothetical protein